MVEKKELKSSLKLKPCPFCGGENFIFVENGRSWSGTQWSKPVSISIRHHCRPIIDQPNQRMIERVGKDKEAAIHIWNMRFEPLS